MRRQTRSLQLHRWRVALNAGDAYTFCCSFPGHRAIMKGELVVVD